MIVFGVWHVSSVCPPQAIKVDQSNVEKHESAAKITRIQIFLEFKLIIFNLVLTNSSLVI